MDTNAKLGDVLAYYLERYNAYCPCQIIAENTEASEVAVLFFNHFSEEIPPLEMIKNLPLLRNTHYYWKDEPICCWIYTKKLENFSFIENHKILVTKTEDYIKNSSSLSQIDLQYAWQQLPKFIQENFKSYDPNKAKDLEGLPDYLKKDLSVVKHPKIIIEEKKTLGELRKIQAENIFSYEMESYFYDENLAQLLAESPIIGNLKISENAPKTVNISKTAINELWLNISGVEKIILNRNLLSLHLKGDFSDLQSIECPFDGKLLSLYLSFDDRFSAFSGLEKVQSLRVDFTKNLDINELKKVGTEVKSLCLMSNGGKIQNILELKAFDKVEFMWLSDVFGFEEFPTKTDFPNLEELRLWSIPKVIGEKLKKEFKSLPELEIKQLRTDEWLKANLENPLRDWDGRKGITQTKSKKAMKAYSEAYKKLSKKGISVDEKIQILTNFIQIFNQIENKWGIDTLEREEIYDAYNILTNFTDMDKKTAETFFDSLRDF